MILQWFDIAGPEPRQFHQERYETEKQRTKLINRAKEDAANSPASQLWIVDVTNHGIETYQLEES